MCHIRAVLMGRFWRARCHNCEIEVGEGNEEGCWRRVLKGDTVFKDEFFLLMGISRRFREGEEIREQMRTLS
jgi:predicted nucleotidyltransferase